MKTQAQAVFILALALSTQSGCNVDPETLESLQAAVNTVSAAQPSDAVGESATEPKQETAESQFVPKFPNRVDPFSFPAGIEMGDQDMTPMATVAAVEVLGFGNVGEAHVLLRINEQSSALRAGESVDGIKVIAINPPTVQLQMGTLIWTATMFDKTDSE